MEASPHFDFLKRVYFFKDLANDEVELIARACTEEDHAPGDILFVEGSIADRFYIVIEGRVEVWKNFYDPKPDLLAVHGPGHFFGEMALVDELPRSATVVAKDPVKVLYLSRGDFRSLITAKTSIALSVMTAISFMVRSSNELYVDDLRKRNQDLEAAYGELQKAQAERLQHERLSTLGKFSSLILHDLRNPLSILKGQIQLMAIYVEEPERLKAHIGASLAEVERLERLASEFLDYSRGEIRLDMAVTLPSELLEKARARVAERLSRGKIEARIEVLYNEPIIVDGERILRALHNVADNACKAMAPKGGGTLTLRALKDGESLVFEVADSGEGMAPEVLQKVFEPFYSASGQGGTGLGMLIVKNIMEAHGGSVRLSSETDKGTHVYLALPLRA